MQPTTLLDNLNTDFLAAFSALMPKGSPQRVLVYVESDEDIAFWRGILTPFEESGLSFDIQLPIKNNLEKGKLAVLEFANRTGNNLILCVDSDYDYLLQHTTDTSTLINGNEFIFQTYTYSIENLLCYAGSLHLVSAQASKNDSKMVDFEALVQLYSKMIYPLFLWSVYFSFKQDTTFFTVANFCETIKILDPAIVREGFNTALQGLKNRVDIKVAELEGRFPNDAPQVEALANTLQPLGVENTNVYLFTHGHTIKNNVTLVFLNPIFNHLKREKEQQIRTNAKHNTALKDQINHYKNQTIPIELALNSNTEYKACFLYKKIHGDLSQYVDNFNNSRTT